MIWFFVPIIILAIVVLAGIAWMEISVGFGELKRANDRYVCKVTGEAWERANKG